MTTQTESAMTPAFVKRKNRSFWEVLNKAILTLILFAVSLLLLSPLLWMLSTSFKKPADVFTYPIQWIPTDPVLTYHKKVWLAGDGFFTFYLNSLKISCIDMVGATLLAAFAAYGFSKIDFKGRNAVFFLYLSMMMIPQQVLFVPKFVLFDKLGIYNTHWALILPGLFTVFGVFLIRQFFLTIPGELNEAAFIDGAGHFRIFFKLMLPLSRPVLVTFAIIEFTWSWNDYENALIFLMDKKLYTVALGMQNFMLENNVDYNAMMAAASASVVPILILFLLGQRYIIQGFASSGVKG